MAGDHYQALHVARSATSAEIRLAYRKLVLLHHPDRSAAPESKEIFLRATEAYEILSDHARRKAYDEQLELEARRKAQPRPRPAAPAPSPPRARASEQTPIANDLSRMAILFARGRYHDAEVLARQILEKDPRQPMAYGMLGDILRGRGDLREAAKMYAYAAQMDSRNMLYQRKYEQLLEALSGRPGQRAMTEQSEATMLIAPCMGFALVIVACVHVVLSKDWPLFPTLPLISTWTLPLIIMLFLGGVGVGAALSVGQLLDRFGGVQTTTMGRLSPSVALLTISMVSFWAAIFLYLAMGLAQRAFNYSTSRLIACSVAALLLFTGAGALSETIDPLQVLLWGGNLLYLGALCGWMVADSLRA